MVSASALQGQYESHTQAKNSHFHNVVGAGLKDMGAGSARRESRTAAKSRKSRIRRVKKKPKKPGF